MSYFRYAQKVQRTSEEASVSYNEPSPTTDHGGRKLRWLKEIIVAVVLDEFDQHRNQTEIVYDLQQVNEDVENELGLILISNKPPGEIDRGPRSESRLNYRTIRFKPYNVDELVAILQDRADSALQSGAIADDVITMVADRIAATSGDCRHAIELLHRAGQIAEQDDTTTITTEHVRQSLNPARVKE